MGNTFKNVKKSVGSSLETAYTCPAATTAIVIGSQLANTDTTTRAARLSWRDYSAGNDTYLLYDMTIPTATAITPISGKMVLEANDYIQTYADVAGKINFSAFVLEMS